MGYEYRHDKTGWPWVGLWSDDGRMHHRPVTADGWPKSIGDTLVDRRGRLYIIRDESRIEEHGESYITVGTERLLMSDLYSHCLAAGLKGLADWPIQTAHLTWHKPNEPPIPWCGRPQREGE